MTHTHSHTCSEYTLPKYIPLIFKGILTKRAIVSHLKSTEPKGSVLFYLFSLPYSTNFAYTTRLWV